MAHFNTPLRPPTDPERSAFAYPDERGLRRPRHDHWGIDIGHRLVAKTPFMVAEYMVMSNEEYVVVDKYKSAAKYKIRSVRDNRISFEATTEEIDARFYVVPGDERTVASAPVAQLLGCDDMKPHKIAPEKDEKKSEK